MYDPYALFEKITLPNGLTVYHQYWDRPWIRTEAVVHTGSREDPLEQNGIAHFVEHCVGHGVDRFRGKRDILEFFRDTGGGVTLGSTNFLSTMYGFNIPVDKNLLRESLSIFGSMLMNEKFERRVNEEREIIIQEFNQSYPFREMIEWDLEVQRELFKGHRLETWLSPLGDIESLRRMTANDLRRHYDMHYTPANMSLLILGGVSKDDVIQMLLSSPFSADKPGSRNIIPAPFKALIDPEIHNLTVSLGEFTKFSAQQVNLSASWALPGHHSSDAMSFAAQTVNHFLVEEIREKLRGSYHFSCTWQFFQDVYKMTIHGKADPNLGHKLEGLVRLCIEQAYLDEKLFDKKKENSLKSLLMSDPSGKKLIQNSAMDLRAHQRIITLKDTEEEHRAVTFEEVRAVLSLMSQDRQHTFMATP